MKKLGITERKAIAQLMRMMQEDGVGRYRLTIVEPEVERSVATEDDSSNADGKINEQ